ncbi:MAG: hypothetical protein AAGK21_15205, partial [Bacteroidota bacterium]
AGVLGEQRPPEADQTAYRDLRYTYGSYVGSLRLARPTRLQFWADASGASTTTVRLQFDADVAWALVPVWAPAMRVFWSGFGTAIGTQVAARTAGAPARDWRRPGAFTMMGAALAAGLAIGLRR